MSKEIEKRIDDELKSQAEVARRQTINEAINSLPSELADWLEQLPPYEKKQVIDALEVTFSTLYEDAYHNGEHMYGLEMNRDKVLESVDEPITKEGEA